MAKKSRKSKIVTPPRLLRNIGIDPSGDRLRRKIVSCGGPNDEGEHIRTIQTSIADLKQEDGSWFVWFELQKAGMYFGLEKPALLPGDHCEIRIFRMTKREVS